MGEGTPLQPPSLLQRPSLIHWSSVRSVQSMAVSRFAAELLFLLLLLMLLLFLVGCGKHTGATLRHAAIQQDSLTRCLRQFAVAHNRSWGPLAMVLLPRLLGMARHGASYAHSINKLRPQKDVLGATNLAYGSYVAKFGMSKARGLSKLQEAGYSLMRRWHQVVQHNNKQLR
ncbi:unnamed protein product [Polarella glacialis]|nr:unnamed protein product [Polarella glacialis]CAE8624424.1 unnamed protein product [Polarella glacialis]